MALDQVRLHRVWVVLHGRGADGFVRVLRVGFRFEDVRLLRQVLVAERRLDVIANRGERFFGDAHRVGAHVGDEPDRAVGPEARQLDPFIELLREHHRLFDGEARRLLQLARDEGRGRVALALLGRDRRDGPRRVLEIGDDPLRLLFVQNPNRVAVLLEQLGVEFRRLRPGEPREDVPVLLGNELLDLPLTIAHKLQRDRLHAACAEAAAHFVPQQRTDLVADEAVEHAAGALGVDHLHVDALRVLDRLLNRLLRDLVEHQAVDLAFLSPELLREMPPDRLALAIRVGRHVDIGGVLGGVLQFFDDFLARRNRLVLLREVVVDGDAQLALGQVADVAHRRDHLEVAPEIFVDGPRLRRRLDHDECFCHGSYS